MADSAFWRDLAAQFQRLHDHHGVLHYNWHYIVGSGNGQWEFAGSASGSVRREFEALAVRAAWGIASPGATDLLVVWFEALRRDGSGFRSTSNAIEPVQTGSIFDVCEASANLCRILERQAFQAECKERQPPHPAPPPSSALAAAPSPPEETIATQLQRLRVECDLTEEALAELVDIDIRSVQRHLASETVPRALTIRKYEKVFSKLLNRQIVIRQMP